MVAAIEHWARLEAAAGARRLAAIAELVSRRCDKPDERAHWSCDFWDLAAAEVAAALGVGHTTASGQMQLGLTLRHRLPKVAALFMDGNVSYRVVSAIAWQTDLVIDDEAAALIDTALAQRATRWGRLSDYKLAQAIDVWVDLYDPGALRRTRARARSRDLTVGDRDDKSDTTSVWGRLYATDAAVLDRRLMEMANEVCDDDPRTTAQRRADALGALAAGADRLACSCTNPHCPAGGNDRRASRVLIHVITEAAALHTQPDPLMNGPDREPQPPPHPPDTPPAGLILSGGIVPAPLLGELIGCGATVRTIRPPADTAEPGYRPSRALQDFIRVRDLTCRFPGCQQPAEFCDIDHTIAHPTGPTHPSNLKCLCRKHHLLKTFWTGIRRLGGSAAARRHSDLDMHRPARHTRPSRAAGSSFPHGTPRQPSCRRRRTTSGPAGTNRGVMMPRRRRTRAADRTRRILEERALNDAYVAERNRPPPF